MTSRSFRLLPSLRDMLSDVSTAIGAAEEFNRAYAHGDGKTRCQTPTERAAIGIPL